jgi:twitching motility protein PilU
MTDSTEMPVEDSPTTDPLAATGAPSGVTVEPLLKLMVERNASDLFCTAGAPLKIKIEGVIYPVHKQVLSADAVQAAVFSLMTADQAEHFRRELEIDFAVSRRGLGRFRVNAFMQRGCPSMVMRHIGADMPKLESLGLPPIVRDLARQKRGMILVVGGSGAGKSTTLAAMIDHRNDHLSEHILTIEDPIEFLHTHRKAIINQREVAWIPAATSGRCAASCVRHPTWCSSARSGTARACRQPSR